MPFEWDLLKASPNEDKHDVSFRGFYIDRADTRRDYGEPRFVAIGIDSNGVVLNVVYTLRGDNIRIISAWKASRHEREEYAKAKPDRSV
jgi:uncharacterized DUF497 family protein